MKNEFDPLITFTNLIQNWWKIVGFAVVGGVAGLIGSFFLPPSYQAEAIYYASIDFTQINFENLVDNKGDPFVFSQYEEDLALQVVERMVIKELDTAFNYAQTLDPMLDYETFNRDYQIQRYHAQWYLRYRHSDPDVAWAVVQYWAEATMDALDEAQAAGDAESFVIVDLVSDAVLPQSPLYHNRNTLVAAGMFTGFILGVLWVDSKNRFGPCVNQEG